MITAIHSVSGYCASIWLGLNSTEFQVVLEFCCRDILALFDNGQALGCLFQNNKTLQQVVSERTALTRE